MYVQYIVRFQHKSKRISLFITSTSMWKYDNSVTIGCISQRENVRYRRDSNPFFTVSFYDDLKLALESKWKIKNKSRLSCIDFTIKLFRMKQPAFFPYTLTVIVVKRWHEAYVTRFYGLWHGVLVRLCPQILNHASKTIKKSRTGIWQGLHTGPVRLELSTVKSIE